MVDKGRLTSDDLPVGGRVLLSADTAAVFRTLARHFGTTMDDLAQDLLRVWLRQHPEIQPILDASKESPKPSQRRKRRPTKKAPRATR
jgi:hypothetical protein